MIVERAPVPARPGALVTALTVLLPIAGIVSAYAGIAFLRRARLLGNELPSFSEISEADDNVANAILAVGLLQIATGVVWIIWQYRHAKRAARLGHHHQLGPGWAIGGWFVPLGNLFLPYRQLLDSGKASAGGAPRVVYAWWAAMVLGSLLIVNGFRIHSSDVQTADQMRGAGYLILAVGAALAVVVVRACSSRQRRALDTGDTPRPGLVVEAQRSAP